jgi:CubicO group peptidase (beta-lactamase class C family)
MPDRYGPAWALADRFPVEHFGVAIVDRFGVHRHGDTARVQRIASVSKPLAAWAVLIAAEEGSVSLDDQVGQEGCTLRHLLAHAGGYPFDGAAPIGTPGVKRIYSNTGYDMIATHVESRTNIPFEDYMAEAVFGPLGMVRSELRGSCAKDVHSCVDDLVLFAGELRRPALVARETYLEAVTPVFPELDGILPGIGPMDPCPWGLGVEIRGHKSPHWTSADNSAATFGHFGGIGTFLWYDPVVDTACVMLAHREFDEWGMEHWPSFNSAVLRCQRHG